MSGDNLIDIQGRKDITKLGFTYGIDHGINVPNGGDSKKRVDNLDMSTAIDDKRELGGGNDRVSGELIVVSEECDVRGWSILKDNRDW